MQKYRIIRNESLKHHGILGMKWGERNGPPYPLAPNKHSASEKKAGWENSLKGGNPSTPQGGAGGGGSREDEEDQKILRELYAELEEQAKRVGMSPMEILSSQNFGLTLSEFTGKGDGLNTEDLNRLRKKAFEHYSKSPVDLALQSTKYMKNEAELISDQIKRGDRKAPTTNTSNHSNNTYTLTGKGLVKEEDKSVWDKIKGKVFGETKVTYGEAKLEGKKDSENKKEDKKDIKTGETYTVTNDSLITDSEKTTWQKIKGKVFGETTVTFNDASIGKESINKEKDTVLNQKLSEYKNNSKLKEVADSAKNWIESTFKREPKKTMTVQDAMRIENEWRAKGLSDSEIDKKFMEEYGDYTVTTGK